MMIANKPPYLSIITAAVLSAIWANAQPHSVNTSHNVGGQLANTDLGVNGVVGQANGVANQASSQVPPAANLGGVPAPVNGLTASYLPQLQGGGQQQSANAQSGRAGAQQSSPPPPAQGNAAGGSAPPQQQQQQQQQQGPPPQQQQGPPQQQQQGTPPQQQQQGPPPQQQGQQGPGPVARRGGPERRGPGGPNGGPKWEHGADMREHQHPNFEGYPPGHLGHRHEDWHYDQRNGQKYGGKRRLSYEGYGF